MTFLNLLPGDHVITETVKEWRVGILDQRVQSVLLTASIESPPGSPLFGRPGHMATKLAVQTDLQVAIRLYEQLGDLIRSTGWQMQVTGGRPI